MSALHVVLVEPEIPWNTGAVGRTCLAAGATLHLVAPLGFSLDEARVRRAGLDYWPRVEVEVWEAWSEFEKQLPRLGEAWFFSSDATRSLWEGDSHPQPESSAGTALLFGAETSGLPREIKEAYRTRLVKIPMEADSVRSLNLSTAVGIALWEWRRRFAVTGKS